MLENLFINIIEISATSAAAIAVILLISKLAESKFRKKWRYWVWVFLAIYLIIPFKFDLPSAPIQMELPQHEMILTRVEEEKVQNAPILEDFEGLSTENKQENNIEHGNDQTVSGNTAENEKTSTEKEKFVFSIVYVGAVIWAFGAILVCGWNIAMYLRFINRSKPWNRAVKNEFVLELFEMLKKEMNVPEKVKIYENRLIKSPMMVGFVNPRVLLPSESLLPEEYEFVLRHELTHYKRKDLFYKFLLMLAASVHWFNPMVGIMCRSADNDIEITCDEAVVKAMEGDRRQEYCAAILNIMRRGQNSPLLLSTSFYGGKKFLKSRFAAVLNPKTKRGAVLFVVAALIILISGTMVACNAGTEEILPKTNDEIVEEAIKVAELIYKDRDNVEKADYSEYLSQEAFISVKSVVSASAKYIENKEITYSGYTPYLTAGIWCGYGDGERSVGNVSVSHIKIWDTVMKGIHNEILMNI
ncbi:MAG: M56 family metallopeptidase, partial [Oscillospiraceae bacterium]|nr:M56 family metallopeptidase [Oscillospiraceae bacterium]